MNKNNNKELIQRVKQNTHFEFMQNGKIKCLLTGHEILPTLNGFDAYVNGKSYKKAIEKNFDFTQFEPYIVENKIKKYHIKNKNKLKRDKLFCNLTKQIITRSKTAVLNHVNGKRYKLYLQKYLEETEKDHQQKKNGNAEESEQFDFDEEAINIVEQPKSQGVLKKKIKKQQKN